MKSIFKKIIIFTITIIAQLILLKYKPKIVGITGSVGKTSTKDSVYAVLSRFYSVRKSDKSFNSDIGIPLTILGCPNGWNDPFQWMQNIFMGIRMLITRQNYPEWLVLEVGADKPGDIERVTKWLHPDVTIVTRFGKTPVHIEFFKSQADVVREKSFLVKALKKDGLLIVNADDLDTLAIGEASKHKTITYGFSDKADLVASKDQILYKKGEYDIPEGITFRVDYDGKSIPVNMKGGFGKNHVYASLGALAVCFGSDLDMIAGSEALIEHEMPPGRMRLLHGVSQSLLIDDTYNSSPVACESALQTLRELKSNGRKIVVFGDMLELGKYSNEEHKKIGNLVSETGDFLIAVGIRGVFFARGAEESGMDVDRIFEFPDAVNAAVFLEKMIGFGDIILVKGSQSMRMERLVKMLLANPETDSISLVRQEKEWQEK